MTAIILSIGDELVLGQTVDTNSAWISQQLAAVGCDIAGHATVPDDQKMIEDVIRSAIGRCDVLIISAPFGIIAWILLISGISRPRDLKNSVSLSSQA